MGVNLVPLCFKEKNFRQVQIIFTRPLVKNQSRHSIDPDITGDKNQINQIKDILENQSPEKMTGLEKKNYETLKKLQGVKNGLLKQLNTQFLSDGSINSHEMFFLDSAFKQQLLRQQ